MTTIHWVVTAGLVTLGVGVLLTNLARDPPTANLGVFITVSGAVIASVGEIFSLIWPHAL